MDTSTIKQSDMVRYRGDWYTVKNIVRYYSSFEDEFQIVLGNGHTEWIKSSEINDHKARCNVVFVTKTATQTRA